MRPFGNFALTVAGFACALGLLRSLLPKVANDTQRAYARAFEADKDCGVLFVGPSYVDEQVLTPIFDEEAARIGLDMKSCKFGLSHLQSYELVYHLERLLSHPWPKLKLVVLDVTLGETPWLEERNAFKPRTIEWHTVDSLRGILDFYARDKRSWAKRLPDLVQHAEHVGTNLLGVGRLAQGLTQNVFVSRPPEGPRELIVGKAPQLSYEERLADLRRQKPVARQRPEDDDWFVALRQSVRRAGRDAYFLYAPVWAVKHPPATIAGDRDSLVLLDFNDPDAYPMLYDERARGRTSHLSHRGRQLYSRYLAHALKEHRRTER